MTKQHWLILALLGATTAALPACGSRNNASSESGGGSAALMTLDEMSNGFGRLVPHTIVQLDASGNPTAQVVQIRTQQDLINNLRASNPVLPPIQCEETAVLPSGAPGNQFIYVRFTQDIDIDTVLESSPAGSATSGLSGAVSVVAIDPVAGSSIPIEGRAFVNGQTYAGLPVGNPPALPLQTWVERDAVGKPSPTRPEGVGFPGTQADFNGSGLLIRPDTLVFVVDRDDNLATHETFPPGLEIRMRVSTAVRGTNGKNLDQTVLGNTTVGPDLLTPEVIKTPPPSQMPLISPGNGDVNVDPLTSLRIQFTEPVQPLSVGPLDGASPPGLSSAITMKFGPEGARTDMPFTARPVSIFDFSVFELIPGFNFPGAGPQGNECGTFAQVDTEVRTFQLQDLASNEDSAGEMVPNANQLGADSTFTTGTGPGVVNAPVAPDTILAARLGALPGISVIDLNGFGQSTGNPVFSSAPVEGNTNFPNNPNVRLQPGITPQLQVGTCTIDGGSSGVFTLTKDSSLNNLLARPPLVTSVSDMMIGHGLDTAFNNAQFPFGCQAGGGDICTIDGLKIVNDGGNLTGPNTIAPLSTGSFGTGNGSIQPGIENVISWAPHPNPPPLRFPPLCITPFLAGAEPSSIDNVGGVNQFGVPTTTGNNPNLLVPGDPFGSPLANPPIPPSGLLTSEQNAYFQGPSQGQTNINACLTYMIRQQIGHFLYVIDRQRGEVVVFNSNRMTVIDRIQTPDPTSLAMGTNLDFIAVTNQQANVVVFIDINPNSSTFHEVVKTTVVGSSPRGIAWEPGNEDILVCNEGDNSLSIISAFSFEARKSVSSQLNGPFEVVVFPRQGVFAFGRNVYFAYILNRSGRVAVFESGPNGVNGWGFDDVIGIAPFEFRNPKMIRNNPNDLFASAWVVHEGPIDPISGDPGPFGEGAVSNLFIESAVAGQLPLTNTQNPQFRGMELGVPVSIGEERLSGVPVDIAFDNLRNLGTLSNPSTNFSAGSGVPVNGKNHYRLLSPYPPLNTQEAAFMFVAVPNSNSGGGVVDVIEIGAAGTPRKDTNAFQPGVQSIPVPNVALVVDYWRQ